MLAVRTWPTAAVPRLRRKLPLECEGCSRERRLTGFVANSHYRPGADVRAADVFTLVALVRFITPGN